MRDAASHRIRAERRRLLVAAASALTVSTVGSAFGKADWLITEEEIAAARRMAQASAGGSADPRDEIARKALDAPNANDITAIGRQPQGLPGAGNGPGQGAPAIVFVKPVQSGRVPAPVDFEVRFLAAAPARIEPSSVKVIYSGLFDITSRILEFGGKIDASGIVLSKAPLKPDSYRVAVVVTDSAGKSARQTVQFTVL